MTWTFRDAFDACGLPGFRTDEETYCRVMPGLDASQGAGAVKQVLADALKRLVVRVVVEGVAAKGSDADRFLRSLREEPNLFF